MSDTLTFWQKVAVLQNNLKAPKGQFNAFGKYKYRSCEDILEAVKPLKDDLVINITDDIVPILDRIYVCATATITDGVNSISNRAFAREPLSKKGMDDSQITGTASSYARKYALNGLLLIDDTKDADTMDNREAKSSKGVEIKSSKVVATKKEDVKEVKEAKDGFGKSVDEIEDEATLVKAWREKKDSDRLVEWRGLSPDQKDNLKKILNKHKLDA